MVVLPALSSPMMIILCSSLLNKPHNLENKNPIFLERLGDREMATQEEETVMCVKRVLQGCFSVCRDLSIRQPTI